MSGQTIKFSDFQKKKLRHFHDIFDRNKDGCVDESDWIAVADRAAKKRNLSAEGVQKLRQEMVQIFRTYFSADGKPSNWKDYIAQSESVPTPQMHEDSKNFSIKLFKAIDVNEDNFISIKEFVDFYDCIGVNAEVAKKVFEMTDTSKDGKLSMEEFIKMFTKYWLCDDPKDPNKDFWGPLSE